MELQDEQYNSQKLENEIRDLQDIIRFKKTNAPKKQEDVEIVIDEKSDGSTLKKLVQKNQQLEKELARLKQKQQEYLSKFKYLKGSWEEKDDNNLQLKKRVEKLKNEINEILIELEKEKLKNQYLEEDIFRLRKVEKQYDQSKTVIQKWPQEQQNQDKQQYQRQFNNQQNGYFQEGQDQNIKIVEKKIEVPVIQEKIIEKIIDRPVEVEKIVEKIIEVPIEKVIEIVKEVPVYVQDSQQQNSICQELNILRRDNENLLIENEGKQREIDSMRNRLDNLEQYNSQNEGAKLASQDNNNKLIQENKNLTQKVELLYAEIKELSYMNDVKNNNLEVHVKNLETLLKNNNIKYPDLNSY